MTTEPIFRMTFWILFTGVFVMRIYFALKVLRAGERVMPNREAVEREGRGMFAVRVVMFFFLLGWLALYATNPTWMRVLSVPFPDWLRWIGFALGLASLGFWSWTQVALGKEWSPQLQLRKEHHLVTTGPYARIRHPLYTAMIGLWNKPCISDRKLDFCSLLNHGNCELVRPYPQGRANDYKGIWG